LLLELHQISCQLTEIEQQVKYNTQLLQELVCRQRGVKKEDLGQCPAGCHLPLKTYSQVLELEQQLKSKQFYGEFVSCSTSHNIAAITAH